LIVADARPHLVFSQSKYDVIVSEPSNPWMAGIAALFTHEFFESARARLAPGGLLCQWAHTYDISADDLRSIVMTFLSVFPDGTLWLVGEGDVLLIGSTGPLDARIAEIGRHYRERTGVAGDLLEVGVHDEFALLSLFVAEGQPLLGYAAGAIIQTDDRMGLEFSGPRGIFGRQTNPNDETLFKLSRTAPPPAAVRIAISQAGPAAWRNRGWMFLRADGYAPAWRDFVRALELDPHDADIYEGLRRAAIGAKREDEALALLRRLAAEPSHLEATLALSRLLSARGAMDEAAVRMFDLVRRYPDSLSALDQLASVLSDANDIERLQPVVAQMRRDAPDRESTRYYTAALLFRQGRPDLAVPEAEAVVQENPGHALAQNLLGATLASLGELDRARNAFEASLRSNPLNPGTYTNLATLEMQTGNRAAAARRYAEALTLEPASDAARRGLAEATRP
jgi:spermidine synthase